MTIWQPRENNELRRLYHLCRRVGAPYFLSAAEMQEWLHQHLESFKFFSLDPNGIISAFKKAGIEIAEGLGKAVKALQSARARAILREQIRRQRTVKSLRKPLQFIPKSLHPDVSAAC
jgi:hypothetical protein